MLSTASRSENQLTVRDTATSQSTAGSQPMSVHTARRTNPPANAVLRAYPHGAPA